MLLHHLIVFALVWAEASPGGQALATCCLLVCVYHSLNKGPHVGTWSTNGGQIYFRLQFYADNQYLVTCQSRETGRGRYHPQNASTRLFLNVHEIWAFVKVYT